jgi:hypothetical protein
MHRPWWRGASGRGPAGMARMPRACHGTSSQCRARAKSAARPTMLRERAYGVPAARGLGAGPPRRRARTCAAAGQSTHGMRQQARAAAARPRGDWRGSIGGCARQLACLSRAGMRRPGHSTQRARLPMLSAFAASGGDERAVETLPPPPPAQETRAAVDRLKHNGVVCRSVCSDKGTDKCGKRTENGDEGTDTGDKGTVKEMKRTRTTSSLRAATATINRVVGRQARQDAMIARRVAALQRRNGGREIGCYEKLLELEQRACTG